jgi:hypothetical protein
MAEPDDSAGIVNLNTKYKNEGPEFVHCGWCQCWNKKHWIFDEETKKGKKYNELFAICQRRAPVVAGEGHGAWNTFYLNIFKIMIPIGIMAYSQRTAVLPTKRFDEGCWEGIRKEKVEECATA